MPQNHAPRVGHALSRKELLKFLGGLGPEYDFLNHFAIRDTVHFKDDFLGDTLDTFWTAVANGGGATVASFAINVQRDGWIRGTTGTAGDDTASASLIGPAIYYGAGFAGMEFRFKPVTAVTEAKVEGGFIDVVPGSTKSAVNSVATPTVNSSVVEAALYSYRHTGSTTTNQLITIGTAIAAQKTNFTPDVTIAAATSFTVRIQIEKTASAKADVSMWFDGILVAHHVLGMTGDVALAPWFYVAGSNGTSKSLDIDYLHIWSNRDFTSTGLAG